MQSPQAHLPPLEAVAEAEVVAPVGVGVVAPVGVVAEVSVVVVAEVSVVVAVCKLALVEGCKRVLVVLHPHFQNNHQYQQQKNLWHETGLPLIHQPQPQLQQ